MMTTALSQHAEEVYAELPDERSRAIAEKLFKALTDKSVDNRGVRRPTRLDELCAVASVMEAEVVAIYRDLSATELFFSDATRRCPLSKLIRSWISPTRV